MRRSLSVDDPQVSVVQALQTATAQSRAVPYISSQAEIYRYLLDLGIERVLEDAEPDVEPEDVTPSDVTDQSLGVLLPKRAVVEYRRNELKADARHDFLSIDVAGRFNRKANELFEGDVHKPHPDGVESIAESFVAEIDMYEDHGYLSEADAAEQRDAVRSRMETYADEYDAAQNAPDMRDVPPEVELGNAVARLRQEGDEFLSELAEKAEKSLTRPDDVVRAMSNVYGVSETVVDALLDEITPDGMPGRKALRESHADVLPTVADQQAIEGSDDAAPKGVAND